MKIMSILISALTIRTIATTAFVANSCCRRGVSSSKFVVHAAGEVSSTSSLPALPRGGGCGGSGGSRPSSLSSMVTRLFSSTTSSSQSSSNKQLPIMIDENVMKEKAHGTSEKPVQEHLRWNCEYKTADRICNYNRHYAEPSGYWESTTIMKDIQQYKNNNDNDPIQFYDSVTGVLLFTAPVGRSMEEFVKESQKHGWPSFRDNETNWDYVRCLPNGECVSITGTHLGHNIPDNNGNRYCINLVSVAGQPQQEDK